jgi:hypothetical protein
VRLEGTKLSIRVLAPSEAAAREMATRIAEQFCDALSLRTGELFSVVYSALTAHPGTPQARFSAVLPVTWRDVPYRLENLAADVGGALDAFGPDDDRLSVYPRAWCAICGRGGGW